MEYNSIENEVYEHHHCLKCDENITWHDECLMNYEFEDIYDLIRKQGCVGLKVDGDE